MGKDSVIFEYYVRMNMKKTMHLSLIITLGLTLGAVSVATDRVHYVNPLVGSDSTFEFSNGNTYPAVALPWGMHFWTPQTSRNGDGWCYQYAARKIRGLKQTHQPSPWINDYGAYSLLATTGRLVFDEDKRASAFSHKAEKARAHYYRVYLADYNTTMEITPTERGACLRLSYPDTDEANLVIDGYNKGSYIRIIPQKRRIEGYVRNNRGGVPENFKTYFIITCDTDFTSIYGVPDGVIHAGMTEVESEHSGAIVRFKTQKGNPVTLRTASSFISLEQAELNLQREIGSRSFEDVKASAAETWNRHLGRIEVEGGTEAQKTVFYTALYRTMLFPRRFYEYNAQNRIIHYSPYNGEIRDGYMFTDNGFWDTFRAVFPFFNLLFRDLNAEIMQGLANAYRESGWLPEWASPGHRDCMIGSNSAVIIADALLKGIPMPDKELLYEAVVKNSRQEGPLSSVGRLGVEAYNRLGYIPYDIKVDENTARTLEYAFADHSIWKMAQVLNMPVEEQTVFRNRAQNYRKVFDPETRFMRGRNADGSFQTPFRPDKWGDAFTEGCSWHWTWSVFHDIQGLIELMGGDQAFCRKLDAVFETAPTFDYSYYRSQIHEITEMQVADMGQYAHGNQPIQHMPYLYAFAGEPWKTQNHVRTIMDKLYTPNPDGLCGDEDNGQTSAWYVFSALGFYPVTPGSGQYVMGSPLFAKATLHLENNRDFVIDARKNGCGQVYIRSASLNGKGYEKTYLDHERIMNGGQLKLMMGDEPNTRRGKNLPDRPYSMSGK